MNTKTTAKPVTANDLINRAEHVPARVQRRYDEEIGRALATEGSCSSDRATHEAVAETFVSVWLMRELKADLDAKNAEVSRTTRRALRAGRGPTAEHRAAYQSALAAYRTYWATHDAQKAISP